MRLTLLLVAALLATPAFAAVTCCQDANGDPYDGCTCLPDNSLLRSQAVAADEYAYYHWAISDYSLTMDDDDARMIEFRVWPCSGDVTLLVAAVSSAFPTNETARWRHHVEGGAETSIRVGLLYAEYFVSVLASSDANFTIGAFTARSNLPTINDTAVQVAAVAGDLVLDDDDPLSMELSFHTIADADAEYRVYYRHNPASADACGQQGNPTECVLVTACGLETSGMPVTEFQNHPANSRVTVTVGNLQRNQQYTFNVVVRSQGFEFAYAGVQGTPQYSRTSAASSNNLVAIVGGIVAGVFVLLVILILIAKKRMQRAYQVAQQRKRPGAPAAAAAAASPAASS